MPTSASAARRTTAPRSLADDLRGRGDDAIAALLRRRVDLLHPVPRDLSTLAARAADGPSVLRALDGYDAFGLAVLAIAAEQGDPATVERVVAAAEGASNDAGTELRPEARHRIADVLATARRDALIWGTDDDPHLLRAARETLETAGADASGIHVPEPPPFAGAERPVHLIDGAAAQAALDVVRRITVLLDAWSAEPMPALRSGGLGIRDLTRCADILGVDQDTAAVLVELAGAAGLVGAYGAGDESFAPTPDYDAWLDHDVAERWSALVLAWFDSPRAACLIGTVAGKDQRLAALGPGLERTTVLQVRRDLLRELAAAPAGLVCSDADLLARLAWRRPRRDTELRRRLIAAAGHEAALLGLTGLGALATPGRALATAELDSRDAAILTAVRAVLPPPVEHIVIQPDLTAIAPGPLRADLDRELKLLADVESTGGATVYRFTAASLRRAFDAGQHADQIRAFLGDLSSTPVPQPLGYLVGDVARTHGALRLGGAGAYLRCDDPETLSELVADRRLADLGLRRVAPTVLVSTAAVPVLADALHAIGRSPGLEAEDGTVVVRPRTQHRATVGSTAGITLHDDEPGERLLALAVRALRLTGDADPDAVDPAAEPRDGGHAPSSRRMRSARTVDVLRTAVDRGLPVRLAYAGSDGATDERLVDPVDLADGRFTGLDHLRGQVRTFALSRITAATILLEEPA